jgi:hypothetical protein
MQLLRESLICLQVIHSHRDIVEARKGSAQSDGEPPAGAGG